MTENDRKLMLALKGLSHAKNYIIPNERENMIICIILLARQYKKHSEIMQIIADNSDKDFAEISQMIIKSDLFPPLEIVDDDEE